MNAPPKNAVSIFEAYDEYTKLTDEHIELLTKIVFNLETELALYKSLVTALDASHLPQEAQEKLARLKKKIRQE